VFPLPFLHPLVSGVIGRRAKSSLRGWSLCLVLSVFAGHSVFGERTFYWSFETETPEVYPAGSDSTPTYTDGLELRSMEAAFRGNWGADFAGRGWTSVVFDNPTNTPTWATPTEGAYSLWWRYTGPLVNGMLTMITGKAQKTAPELDTNEGISIRFKDSDELLMGYGWGAPGEMESVAMIMHLDWGDPMPLLPDTWYHVTGRWKVDETYQLTLVLRVEDQTGKFKEETKTFQVGPWVAQAFHQVLIGNDRNVNPDGWYIYEYEVWDDFDMVPAQEETWCGYPVVDGQYVYTDDWLGTLYLYEDRHWTYSFRLADFLYFPDIEATNGAWVYVRR